ncbi:hypothetical protein K7472_02470 [Streptomyces sp. PTM05]|uniref:Uncharacterized protein n=1 Tax=Streptantibioticus parmotrematis TaxID=2873249 RepID=A0ABS7QMT2_9ACTN|nr:hypothetical protein [Streptantibioticus parmotrematis]MBY8883710.1 hypothetical protein [Streptantibioticus parmotrematis]
MTGLALRAHRTEAPGQPRPLDEAATGAFTGSFTDELDHWRERAGRDWRALSGPADAPPVPGEVPGYLVDRYAFRAYLADGFGVRIADRFSRPFAPQAARWQELTRSRLRGIPGAGLPAVRLEQPVTDTPLVHDLLGRWRRYLTGLGITYDPALFQPPDGRSWLELFRDSVLYPFYPPAIPGPTFVERLSPRQCERLLERHGRAGIMSLYVFLLQAHEDTHRAQRGEPLLCEYVLAVLWCRFLDEHDLWYWERNEDSGVSLNLEEPYLRRVHLDDRTLRALVHDTASGAGQALGPGAYEELCLAGWLFDTRAIAYQDYLELVTLRLGGTALHERLTLALSALDARLSATPRHGAGHADSPEGTAR